MKARAHKPETIPPEVPDDLAALDRAIMLLGERQKYDLKTKKQVELATLLGHYPDPETAAAWKSVLKQLRKDDIFQADKG